jgi:hypothetical protein
MNTYVHTWASLAQNNNLLKILVSTLTLLCLLLSGVILRQSMKPPLIIERACASRVAATSDIAPTSSEVESFIREALSARFDTDSHLGGDLLSLSEIEARQTEQTELKKHEIKQRIFLNTLTQAGSDLTADVDRLLSVGAIRSAFSFPLKLTLERTQRTNANPYGLVLTEIKPIDTKADQSKQNQSEKKE